MPGLYILGFTLFLGVVKASPAYLDTNPAYISDLKSRSDARVVGGLEALEGQIPHQISLRMVASAGTVASCGGSIIHHEWVITAAHCIAARNTYVIRFGGVNLTRPAIIIEENESNGFLHPNYIPSLGVQRDDIALIKLSRSIPYGPTIQPIRLQNSQQRDDDYTGVRLTVSGFGRTDDPANGGAASEVLMWTFLRGISNAECRRFFLSVHPQTVCAQYYNNTSQSACQGDSGGPLTQVDADGKLTMVGIVSFGSGTGCNNPIPTAYVRPGYYIDWIKEVTGIDFDWTIPEQPEQEPQLAY